MKKNLILVSFLVAGLVLIASVLSVSAQGPTNTYPAGANGADNQSHFAPGSAHLWYYFQFAGDGNQFTVVLVNGAKDNFDFNLYLPSQIAANGDYDPKIAIGRGSRSGVACPAGQDSCDASNNKGWLGSARESGRYYVEVINNNADGKAFLLQVNGPKDSLSLQPPTPTSQPTPAPRVNTPAAVAQAQAPTPNAILTLMAQVAATLKAPPPADAVAVANATPTATVIGAPAAPPSAPLPTETPQPAAPPVAPPPPAPLAVPSATATPDNFYWTSASWVYDQRLRVIPPQADNWFKFEHSGDKSTATLLILDATLSGLQFKVYTSQQASNYANEDKPIGAGAQPPGVCPDGPCSANDLLWSGSFSSPDTIYIRVTNTSSKYANFRLRLSGTGIVQGH